MAQVHVRTQAAVVGCVQNSGAEKEAINSACMQLVLDGGILYKYHRNLPWSPVSLHISVDHKYLSSTTNQADRQYTVLFTLGNIETHPAVPLLKQRLHMQDNGGRAGATGVFLGKSPHLDGRWGGGILEDTLSKANVNVRKGRLCFLCLHIVILGWQTQNISVNITHGLSTEYITALLFSLKLLQKPGADGKPLCRSNQSKEY